MNLELAPIQQSEVKGTGELGMIAARVSKWHTIAVRAGEMFHVTRFMIGRELLRAKELVPAASRGKPFKATQKSQSEILAGEQLPGGYIAWQRQQFPHIPTSTLRRYRAFATEVLEANPDLNQMELFDARTLDIDAESQLLKRITDCAKKANTADAMVDMGLLTAPKESGQNWKYVEWVKLHRPAWIGDDGNPTIREPDMSDDDRAQWNSWRVANEKPKDMAAQEKADAARRIEGMISDMRIFSTMDYGTKVPKDKLAELESHRLSLGHYLKGFKL